MAAQCLDEVQEGGTGHRRVGRACYQLAGKARLTGKAVTD